MGYLPAQLPRPERRNFWSYDDPQVIAAKTAYIKANGLGGTMMWSLDGDTAAAALTTAIDTGLS